MLANITINKIYFEINNFNEGCGDLMILKKGFICIWVAFGCMPSLFGDNENFTSQKIDSLPATSKKASAKTEISIDIERPLLRPVELEKKDTITNDQKTAESLLNPNTEQYVESIVSILSAEKKKLLELENEYNKLQKDVMDEGNAKNHEIDVNKETESMPNSAVNEHLQSSEKSTIVGTSSALARISPLKDASVRDGGSTVHPSTMKDNKTQEVGLNNDLNQRLSKVIGNVSLLDLAECFYKLCEYDNALQAYKLITPTDTSLDQYMWAQYQIANCYRNMKKFDIAFGEYQRFVNQYPSSDLIEQAKWYIDDINWWKSWYEKKALANNPLLAASSRHESK